MSRRTFPLRLSTSLATILALATASGWAWRETVFARERAALVTSQTIGLDHVSMTPVQFEGNPVGAIGVYLDGPTEASSSLVAGRFILDPGKSPHRPHVHRDEEIMVIESGRGEIICDGKTTKIGPGSVMYSAPNVPHGINNTGAEPLTFYYMKWLPKTQKSD